MLVGAGAVAFSALAAAAALYVLGHPGVTRVLLALSTVSLGALAAIGLAYAGHRRVLTQLRMAPGEHALAFGPDGVLITLRHLGVAKMVVIPYRETLNARLIAPNALWWELAWGSSLLSTMAPRDLDAEAPRVLQELRLAHHLLGLGHRVTAAGLDALASQEAARWRATEHASPEALDTLARRANPQDAPLGVWVAPWSRPARRVATQLALCLALALPIVTALPAMAALLYLLFSRGQREGHRLVLLPDALLICEGTTRVLPRHTIHGVDERGDHLVLSTSRGEVLIDAGYGLTPRELTGR
jgi:hypothetical protein